MHRRQKRPDSRTTVDQLAQSLGLTLQRLTSAFSAATPRRRPPVPVRTERDAVARARAALSDARDQMPGLMSASPILTIDNERELERNVAAAPALVPDLAHVPTAGDLRLARMEEMVLHLDAERAQARSEIEALRQIAAELREALMRLDDRSSTPAGVFEPDDHMYPAGSIGVELRLTEIQHEVEVDQLRATLAARTEVDAVRVSRMRRRKARLRVYLRLPLGRAAYLDLLRHAAPLAVPIPGPTPGSISLQLHPS
jgi:hypothetical protein